MGVEKTRDIGAFARAALRVAPGGSAWQGTWVALLYAHSSFLKASRVKGKIDTHGSSYHDVDHAWEFEYVKTQVTNAVILHCFQQLKPGLEEGLRAAMACCSMWIPLLFQDEGRRTAGDEDTVADPSVQDKGEKDAASNEESAEESDHAGDSDYTADSDDESGCSSRQKRKKKNACGTGCRKKPKGPGSKGLVSNSAQPPVPASDKASLPANLEIEGVGTQNSEQAGDSLEAVLPSVDPRPTPAGPSALAPAVTHGSREPGAKPPGPAAGAERMQGDPTATDDAAGAAHDEAQNAEDVPSTDAGAWFP